MVRITISNIPNIAQKLSSIEDFKKGSFWGFWIFLEHLKWARLAKNLKEMCEGTQTHVLRNNDVRKLHM